MIHTTFRGGIMNKNLLLWIVVFLFIPLVSATNATYYNVPSEYNFSTAQNLSNTTDVINISNTIISEDFITNTRYVCNNVTVTGGLQINSSAQGARIIGCNITGSISFGSTGDYGLDALDKTGIYILASNIYLYDMTVNAITGSEGEHQDGTSEICINGKGSDVYGIYANFSGVMVNNITINSLTGGVGTDDAKAGSNDDDCTGGQGGDAVGAYLKGGYSQILNSNISLLTGGDGGRAHANNDDEAYGGLGGRGIGVFLTNYSSIINVTVNTIKTGNTGNSYAGSGSDNDASVNGRDGESAFFIYGEEYNTIIGNTLKSLESGDGGEGSTQSDGRDVDGGNAGYSYGIYIDSNGVIKDNIINGITTGDGKKGERGNVDCEDYGDSGDNGKTFGIYVFDNITIINNNITDFKPGNGAEGGNAHDDGGDGSSSLDIYGIYSNIKNNVSGNYLNNLTSGNSYKGGKGYDSSCSGATGGTGGSGSNIIGVFIDGNLSYVFNNIFSNFTGGDGSEPGESEDPVWSYGGDGGTVYGIYINNNSDLLIHYNNSYQNFIWGSRGCDFYGGSTSSAGRRCEHNPNDFGNLYPVYPKLFTEVSPDFITEASDEEQTITFYQSVDIYSEDDSDRTNQAGIELNNNMSAYWKNWTGIYNLITFLNNSNCTNISCSFVWNYSTNKGRAYLNITTNSSTVDTENFTNTTTSYSYYILPYYFYSNITLIDSVYRNITNLSCNYTIVNEVGYNTTANISWFLNGVLNVSEVYTNVVLDTLITSNITINQSELVVDDIWTCNISLNDSTTINTSAENVTVNNYIPTNPINLTCDSTVCSNTLNNILYIYCDGSTDVEGDNLSYYIAGYSYNSFPSQNLLWYRFKENTGNITKNYGSLGETYNASIEGNYTWNSTNYSNRIVLNGTGGFINTTYQILDNSSFSFGIWYKIYGEKPVHGIVESRLPEGNQFGFYHTNTSYNNSYIQVWNSTGSDSAIHVTTDIGVVYYDVITYADDCNISFYRNGEFNDSKIFCVNNVTNILYLGEGVFNEDRYLNGTLGEFIFWNKTLTSIEVNASYNYFLSFWESWPSTNVVDKRLNVEFCSDIGKVEFLPNLSNYNWTTNTLTEYNVTATNVTNCLYNFSCSYNCPVNITFKVNTTSTTHNITCNNIVGNTSEQRFITNLNTTSFLVNCTMDYVNASSGFNYNTTFDIE